MKLRTLVLSGALLASPFCGAAFAQGTGFYAGVNYGVSHYGLSTDVVTDQAAKVTQTDPSNIAWSGTLGYKLSDMWSVEGIYFDAGKAVIRGTGAIATPGTFSLRVHRTNYGVALNWMHSLGEKLTFNAKGGAHIWDIEYEGKGSILPVEKDDGKDIFGGVGLSYNINERISLNIGIDRFWGGNSQSVSFYSGGAKLKF